MASAAKEYLLSIARLKLRIIQREEQEKELEGEMFRLSAGTGMGGGHSSDSAAYTRIYERLSQLRLRTEELRLRYQETKDKIIGEIQQLENPVHVDLLYKRYVEQKPLRLVAQEMNYDYDYIRQLHSTALRNFETSHTISHFKDV